MSLRVVGTGKVRLGFGDESFYETVKNALANWFGMDIGHLPEAFKLMGLKDSKYVIEKRDVDATYVSMKLNSSKEVEYELNLYRGDMVNPYPTWVLIDESNQLRKCFSVEMRPTVELISTMNSNG